MERAALRPGFRGFKGWWWRLAPQVGADYVGGLCRRGGRRPFGPRVLVSPLRGDEYEVSVTGLPSRPHLRAFCIECASRPKPSLSLHIKGPSDCRLTDSG